MAHHKSAKIRIRRNERRRQLNKKTIGSMRTAIKKFLMEAEAAKEDSSKKEGLAGLLKSAQSSLATAATKGVIHKNNANRRISRLSKHFTKITA